MVSPLVMPICLPSTISLMSRYIISGFRVYQLNIIVISKGVKKITRFSLLSRSTSNKLLVIFESDGTVQKAGFSATFMKEFDECASIEHGCSHSCVNTLGGYECACDIGYELHSDGKKCESKCKLRFLIS